ncbi:hypothetical protein Riv7116_1147 [Rivularia sp. PCC 7116]|uniref:hypothetical protein n=1 Tax=Rivularia sp. PCC 7116 TaxID=373994 RepID=UPI00029EE639|nr:hypothetical protein [Rivularia sp. PCC 7116]AFY53720.1 hypothetical protein Riv7116_1147 [Rivularia sp. PCC 7116]
METSQIIEVLPNLSISERLQIAEAALLLISKEQDSLTKEEQKHQLALAAMTAIADYAPEGELNIFTAIDGEEFYEYSDNELIEKHTHE